jgi:hypothetical protein
LKPCAWAHDAAVVSLSRPFYPLCHWRFNADGAVDHTC